MKIFSCSCLGDGEGVLIYGNGYPSGTVTVTLNGNIIDEAPGYTEGENNCPFSSCGSSEDHVGQYNHDGTREVHFTYKSGEVLRIEEDFAIFCVHSLVLTTCPGMRLS